MMLFLLLCISLAVANQPPECGKAGSPIRLRRASKFVLGGQAIEHSAMPWLVALKEKDNTTFCTGSLISDRHVLTAAHCFMTEGICENVLNHKPLKETSICHGVSFNDIPCKGDGVTEYKAKRVINLEAFFNNECKKNDFAILELEKPVPNVMPVCLPEKSQNQKGEMISAGYSPNYEAHEIKMPLGMNRKLRAANVGERVDCNPEDPDDVICAKQTNEGAICQGDSGGPLMQKNYGRYTIIGVHSTANFTRCYPSGLYNGETGIQKSTDIFKHLPEIEAAMK